MGNVAISIWLQMWEANQNVHLVSIMTIGDSTSSVPTNRQCYLSVVSTLAKTNLETL
jgi:hypothetical protein